MSTAKKNTNVSRGNKARMKNMRKIVMEAWEKAGNPNFFGGSPVLDPSGRIISIEIHALGYVAKVFEEANIQEKLVEAFRKNKFLP